MVEFDPEFYQDYLELDEFARRMGLTVQQVRDLVNQRVLKAVNLGLGLVLVRPEINNYTP